MRGGGKKKKPIAATALDKSFTTRSLSSPILGSVKERELRMAYIDKGTDRVGVLCDIGIGDRGRWEKRLDEDNIKNKYRTMT